MSSALVPSNSSNFAQQGSVDWVSLSNTSVSFTLGVLGRLSKAGVDALTIQVGRAICFNFALAPQGQARLTDAIQRLKKYASYGDLIWFGFGLKHVVVDLSASEEGLTLVGICAALSVTYDNLYSAQVLRDLCHLCKAPESLTPALGQWRALLNICSGILSSGSFSLRLNGFHRLISRQCNYPTFSSQAVMKSSILAGAILTLGQVSKGKFVNVTFMGGLDCAWLAALAEELLSLDVEVLDASDEPLYRTQSRVNETPQVIFRIFNGEIATTSGTLRTNRTYLVESGGTVLIPSRESRYRESPSTSILQWRAPWSHILHDTFHEASVSLMNGALTQHFATFLYYASSTERPYGQRNVESQRLQHDCRDLLGGLLIAMEPIRYNNSSRGRAFLKYAAHRLPELTKCSQLDFSSITSLAFFDSAWEALIEIRNSCSCVRHSRVRFQENKICLEVLSITIFIFLSVLEVSTVDEDVYPSVGGLQNLYLTLESMITSVQSIVPFDFIFNLFSGLKSINVGYASEFDEKRIAKTGGGICICRNIIENPSLPPTSIFNFRIFRGYIAHAGTVYKEVHHLAKKTYITSPLDSLNFMAESCAQMLVHAVVKETDDEKVLSMGYQVTCETEIDKSGSVWLNFERLSDYVPGYRNILKVKCQGGCRPLYDDGINLYSNIKIIFGARSVNEAQEALNQIRGGTDRFILMVNDHRDKNGEEHLTTMIIAEPLMLYVYISKAGKKYKMRLISMDRCLTCILKLDHLWYNLPLLERDSIQQMKSRGKIMLVTPERPSVCIDWSTLKQPSSNLSVNDRDRNDEDQVDAVENSKSQKHVPNRRRKGT